MITLEISCSMCGQSAPEIDIESKEDFTLNELTKRLKKERWIVQINGDNLDTYCGKECAK